MSKASGVNRINDVSRINDVNNSQMRARSRKNQLTAKLRNNSTSNYDVFVRVDECSQGTTSA